MALIYGYIRVSTRDQNEDRQVIALREMAVPEDNIYRMTCSISRALTVWGGITRKSWSSGAS